MRNLEQIEAELQEARETLTKVKGTPTEVYSRIVGYYRSVRNWNKGKREEYTERKLFHISDDACRRVPKIANNEELWGKHKLLLFVRSACPACLPAKNAAVTLGIPVEFVDADTEEGLLEANQRNVLSTPTAILLNASGKELARARDARSILSFGQNQYSLDSAV